MDDGSSKNAHFIDELDRFESSVKSIRERIASSYNSEISRDVVKALRQAEHLLEDQKESLK